MREILFRGKRTGNGEWIEGCFSKQLFGHPCVILEDGCAYYEIDAETVGQYTGLTDKNGKKIFEGDIVMYSNTIFEVAYITKYARFAGKKPGVVMSIFLLEDSEVIGNIHDNPELLEKNEHSTNQTKGK